MIIDKKHLRDVAPRQILVIGSAHLDILSSVTGDARTVDKIGGLSIQFGGTAYNLLVNLSQLGHPCRFVSGMKRSPFTGLILDNLKHAGVDLMVQQRDDVPLGGFNAHLVNGDLASAVSSMPVERFDLSDDLLRDAMAGMDAIILECNLSEPQIRRITRLAGELGIPFFAGAVSEEKSLRLLAMESRAAAVFMNEREACYLSRSASLDKAALERLRDEINAEQVVITAGCNPVCVLHPGGISRFEVKAIDLPNGGNYLGAGDLFMALTVDHASGGGDLSAAVASAIRRFPEAAFTENCSMEDTGLIEQRMNEVDTMAKFDAMTGLNNRRAGELALNSEISRARRRRGEETFSVLIFDIDKFKTVNDTYGHAEGDRVIAAVAKCLRECVRDIDTGIRWGGEEFICLLPMTDLAGAMTIAERIRAHIEATVKVVAENHPVRPITVSIGVAEHVGGMSAATLVKLADEGLYAAKEGGRNQVRAAQDLGELYQPVNPAEVHYGGRA